MIEWLVKRKVFRNANHAIWFLCTAGIFLLAVIHRVIPQARWPWLVIPLVVHLPPLVTSAIVTSKNYSSEVYSRDCIWFNAGMVILYGILWKVGV